MAKLWYDPDRWSHILTFYYCHTPEQYHCFAQEASSYAKVLDRLASKSAKEALDQLIVDSLESGDSWLHRGANNANLPDTIVLAENSSQAT